jgi:hypothetical protein
MNVPPLLKKFPAALALKIVLIKLTGALPFWPSS